MLIYKSDDCMIIGFTGMPGSGKSDASLYLKEHHNFSIVNMGEVVRRTMNEKGIKITNESLRAFSGQLRDEMGRDATAKLTADFLLKLHGNICIDGIRGPEEVAYFKKVLDGKRFYLIAITAPDDIRYKRLAERGRYDDPHTLKGLKERDEKEKGFGVEAAMKMADIVISNTQSPTFFHEDLDKMIVKLKSDWLI